MSVTASVLRAEASRLLSLRDTQIVAAAAVVVVFAGAWAGVLVDGPIAGADGYLRNRSALPLVELALPLWCAAVAAARAGERRHGVEAVADLATPSRVRTVLSGAAVALAAGALVGGLAGIVGVVVSTGAAPGAALALGHVARCAAVFAVLGLVAYGVGSLLRSEFAAWALVLGWCLLGERLLASVPGLGDLLGAVLPLRSADYFLYGDDRGAPYAWGPGAAFLVTLVWAATALAVAVLARTVFERKETRS